MNIHQETCLWLVEFVYGVVRTINVELALSLKDEGKTFMVRCVYMGVARRVWVMVYVWVCLGMCGCGQACVGVARLVCYY